MQEKECVEFNTYVSIVLNCEHSTSDHFVILYDEWTDVVNLVTSREFVRAIKALRTHLKCSLKEGKDIVDAMRRIYT